MGSQLSSRITGRKNMWLRGVSPLLFHRHSAERPNRRPGYLAVRTCTGEDSPFHPFSPVDVLGTSTLALRLAPLRFEATWSPRFPRWV